MPLRAAPAALVLATALFAVHPPAARAAVCSDFPNQAAAQRAHDTRDADHDGIYCEALPCPCLRPGRGAGASVGTPARQRRRSPADRPVAARCRRGLRADRRCTPGARLAGVGAGRICTPGYASRVRNVSLTLKRAIYSEYGIVTHRPGAYEVDHLISLEIGGSNSPRNLWPEPYGGAHGAHAKDGLENRLHAEVCDGQLTVSGAQREIVAEWTTHPPARRGAPTARPHRRRGAPSAPTTTATQTTAVAAKRAAHRSGSSATSVLGWILLAVGALYFFSRQRRHRRG